MSTFGDRDVSCLAEGRRQRAEGRNKEEGNNNSIIFCFKIKIINIYTNVWFNKSKNMSVLESLLPGENILHIENCDINEAESTITVKVSSVQAKINCPICDFPTTKIHSHYERKLADLSWANYSTSLELRVRKFFCINTECFRRIFTERLPNTVVPWARQTIRFASQLKNIGLALGGAAGIRLSKQLGFNASRNTLLNLVRKIPLPLFDSLKIIGVDDFCFRKCKTYGTIIVDLETNKPVTLLKESVLLKP